MEDEHGEFVLQRGQEAASEDFTYDRIRIVSGQVDRRMSAGLATILAGTNVELVLRPDRFIFRPLELPRRASEFMPGIVRSQIDRLTPWDAADAAFGWSQSGEESLDKMIVTIAATTLGLIKPYVQAIADIGARSISVFAGFPESNTEAGSIKVWEQSGLDGKDTMRIRRALVAVLSAACITSVIALGVNAIVGTQPFSAAG